MAFLSRPPRETGLPGRVPPCPSVLLRRQALHSAEEIVEVPVTRSKKHTPRKAEKEKGRGRYTPAELFVALIGVGVLVLVVGMVVSELLE
jgi:hypothetical protein